jgi:hypothetical protein
MLHLPAAQRAVLRATPPVMAADGVGTPVSLGIMWLCRRDRRHGKPGGLLHLPAARWGGARSLACHAASHGGGRRWNPRIARDCVALPARPPAWQAWRLAPLADGVLGWSAQSCVPRRQSPVAADGVGTPVPLGLCCSAGALRRMARLTACSTRRRLESLPHVSSLSHIIVSAPNRVHAPSGWPGLFWKAQGGCGQSLRPM